MTTSITRRLRLVGTDEAKAMGTADAQQLLSETFPADESRTPAEALYTTLVEFVALAHDGRLEELNERLKGFCDVVGPVLYRHQAPTAPASANGAQLLAELQYAHTIIRNALAVMTTDQKTQWGDLNERDQVAGEGITRANERALAIAAASNETESEGGEL